ncbi:MAG: hypothetical protein IPJ85_18045 [Flavobacteriales bacterium]|nr:hypothetical protein [Flavobacteriales bacterium]
MHQPGKLEVDASIHGFDKHIVQKVEMTLYKVVLELVANVLKHARASRLTLDAVRDDDSITIIIEDDGQGFVEANSKAGLGLKGVRERVASIGGSVRWESSPGRGTTVVVDVPLGSGLNGASPWLNDHSMRWLFNCFATFAPRKGRNAAQQRNLHGRIRCEVQDKSLRGVAQPGSASRLRAGWSPEVRDKSLRGVAQPGSASA